MCGDTSSSKKIMMKKIFFSVLIVCLIAPACWASKASDVKKGNRLFEQEDYAASLEKYQKVLEKDPNLDIANFNAGAASYKSGQFEKAIDFFRQSLLGETEGLKRKAYYNLGNSLYRHGIGFEESNLPLAVEKLEEALKEYEKARDADLSDDDVHNNYEFVSKELERLKKKLEQQQQEDQQNSMNDQQEQGNQDQKNENQQQEGEQQQNQNQQGTDEQAADQQQGASGQAQGAQQNAQPSQEDMSQKEARRFLMNYQMTEEPKEMLPMHPRNIQYREVEKDW